MSDFSMASLRSGTSSSLYSLVALGSALAAGMLYVVFGPDDGSGGGRSDKRQRRRRRQRGYPPGMRNVGNYCFVNATLQVQPIVLRDAR